MAILAEVNDDAHTAAVGFFVKTGARDDTPDVMGVSHFLEHMMFKGTARRSAEDVNREFDEIGANYNAYTSHEQTVYYAHTLPEVLPQAVDLFADMLRPSLLEDDFDTEKQVILEEIGMYDDRPEWRLQDCLLEEHYADHGLGYRVLGTTDTVGDLTADQMRGYFNQRYSPDNLVVSAAGRLDFDQLCADLESRCGQWSPTDATRTYTDPIETDKRIVMNQANVTRQYLAMLCPGPSAQDEIRYASKVLADVQRRDGSPVLGGLIPAMPTRRIFVLAARPGRRLHVVCVPDPDRAEAVEAKSLKRLMASPAAALISTKARSSVRRTSSSPATLQGERPAGRMQALGVSGCTTADTSHWTKNSTCWP